MALARQGTNYHSLAISLQTRCMEETFYALNFAIAFCMLSLGKGRYWCYSLIKLVILR